MDDKILGMFYAGVMGDILGSPYEFYKAYYLHGEDKINTRDENPSPYFLEEKVYIPFRFATTEIEPFSYSDDTSMTIKLLESLVDRNFFFKEKHVIENYQRYANTPRCALGKNTRELLKDVTTYNGYLARFNKKFTSKEIKDSCQSNGCIMRASPLIFARNHEDAVKRDVYLTNPNSISYHCVLLYVKYLRHEIFDEEIDFDRKYNKEVVKFYQYAIDGEIIKMDHNNKGWVVYCLYLAIYMYTHVNSYEEAVDIFFDKFWKLEPEKGSKSPVSDTDTLLTVALSLLGAKLGLKKMKEEKSFASNLKKMEKFDDEIWECLDFTLTHVESIYTTNVVRIRRKDGKVVQDCDLYIGRAQNQGGWNLKASKWQNPFPLKSYSLEESLELYENHVRENLYDDLHELEGLTLGCWCDQGERDKESCHGHVLIRLLKE